MMMRRFPVLSGYVWCVNSFLSMRNVEEEVAMDGNRVMWGLINMQLRFSRICELGV